MEPKKIGEVKYWQGPQQQKQTINQNQQSQQQQQQNHQIQQQQQQQQQQNQQNPQEFFQEQQQDQVSFYTCIHCQQNTAINQSQNKELQIGSFNSKLVCTNCDKQFYIIICKCKLILKSKNQYNQYQNYQCSNCQFTICIAVCPYKGCYGNNLTKPDINQHLSLKCCNINCNQHFYCVSCRYCQNKFSVNGVQYSVNQQNPYQCQECQHSKRKVQLKCFNCDQVTTSLWNQSFCKQCELNMYPKMWNYMDQDTNSMLVPLDSSSQEFYNISNKFYQEDQIKQNYQILYVYRVQNKLLWDNYIFEKYKMKTTQTLSQLEPIINEEYLWNGSRQTDPRVICQNKKEAFDITYSNDRCMWGKAAYFSNLASYSSKQYSYKTQDTQGNNINILMLVSVATGYSITLPSQNSLTRPPNIQLLQFLKQNNNNNQSIGQYDTVKSNRNANNLEFSMLYGSDTRRAYPAYLIGYKDK